MDNKKYYKYLVNTLNEYEKLITSGEINTINTCHACELKLTILSAFELAAKYYNYNNAMLKILYKQDFDNSGEGLAENGNSKSHLPPEFVEKFLEKFLKTY